jgi:hypothetical protein
VGWVDLAQSLAQRGSSGDIVTRDDLSMLLDLLQKKDLLSSSVSTNSVDIDNPVPQEGKRSAGQSKKTCF